MDSKHFENVSLLLACQPYRHAVRLAGATNAMTHCPKCRRPFATIDTKVVGKSRIRYMGCRKCGTKGGKVIIPLEYAPIRLVGFALHLRKRKRAKV